MSRETSDEHLELLRKLGDMETTLHQIWEGVRGVAPSTSGRAPRVGDEFDPWLRVVHREDDGNWRCVLQGCEGYLTLSSDELTQMLAAAPVPGTVTEALTEAHALLRSINAKTLLPEENDGDWGANWSAWLKRRDAALRAALLPAPGEG